VRPCLTVAALYERRFFLESNAVPAVTDRRYSGGIVVSERRILKRGIGYGLAYGFFLAAASLAVHVGSGLDSTELTFYRWAAGFIAFLGPVCFDVVLFNKPLGAVQAASYFSFILAVGVLVYIRGAQRVPA